MLALMADDVEVTFLGQGTFHGHPAACGASWRSRPACCAISTSGSARCSSTATSAAAVWEETATTADGEPWENHGVDVIRVRDGRIVSCTRTTTSRLVHAHFPAYEEVR